MCNSEMDLGLEASKYKNPRFDIVSRIAYLLGVSEEYFLGEESNFDETIYTGLEECKDARIVRNLCIIRTALLRNNGRIRNLFQYDMKNIDTIPEYIDPECIKKLKKDEVDIWRANWTPAKYVVLVSAEIKKHINGCKNSFPLWLNWDYVKDMFCLPELKERQVSKLVESYGEKRNRFPYTMYVVGALSVEVGNILYNDEKFVSYLYMRNGDMFDDLSKVTDASDEIKKNIKDYIRDNQEITIVVDCENANPYKLYSVLDGLEPATREHIKKIVLYNDVHTTVTWRLLQRLIPGVEHKMIPRVKADKSLVDISLAVGTTREYFEQGTKAFILVSSDSDFWGLIKGLPECSFLLLVEQENTSSAIKSAMIRNGIPYAEIDDFCSSNLEKVYALALNQEVQNALGKYGFCMDDILAKAVENIRINLSPNEVEQYKQKYLKNLHTVQKNGYISLEI